MAYSAQKNARLKYGDGSGASGHRWGIFGKGGVRPVAPAARLADAALIRGRGGDNAADGEAHSLGFGVDTAEAGAEVNAVAIVGRIVSLLTHRGRRSRRAKGAVPDAPCLVTN